MAVLIHSVHHRSSCAKEAGLIHRRNHPCSNVLRLTEQAAWRVLDEVRSVPEGQIKSAAYFRKLINAALLTVNFESD